MFCDVNVCGIASWFTCRYPSPFWIFFSKLIITHLYDNYILKTISYSYYLMFKLLYLNLFTLFIFWPSPVGRCVCVNSFVTALNMTNVYICCCHCFCTCIQMILKLCKVTSEDICNYLKWDSSVAVYIE